MTYLRLALALLFILLHGFCVAAESALGKVRRSRLEQLVAAGHPRARVVRQVLADVDGYLRATQLGSTLASLGLGWLGQGAVATLLAPLFAAPWNHLVAGTLAFAALASLHIVLGQWAPQGWASERSEAVALASAGPLWFIHRLVYPVLWALNGAALGLLRLFGLRPAVTDEVAHTEEELRMLLSASAERGYLDETEHSLLANVFTFSERVAREVMVPRGEMVCLYLDEPLAAGLRRAASEGHTRYPLCGADKDDIVGFVHIKDLLRAEQTLTDLRAVARPILAVPEGLAITALLKEMQRRRTHLAILVDEYGGTAGLVTLEDLLEEIVGDIRDEFDDETPELVTVAPDTYEVDGGWLIEEAEARLGLQLEQATAAAVDTLGGYIFTLLGRKPRVGDEVRLATHVAQVVEVEGFRIARVRLSPTQCSPTQRSPAQPERAIV